MNPTVALRTIAEPEILHRADGYVLWHGGIIDGPHGLAVTVEVLDESGAGRLVGEDWGSSSARRWPLEVLLSLPAGRPVAPYENIEARSSHYYRLICTFGKFGRGLGPRPGPDGAQLELVVHPLELRVQRLISGTPAALADATVAGAASAALV